MIFNTTQYRKEANVSLQLYNAVLGKVLRPKLTYTVH